MQTSFCSASHILHTTCICSVYTPLVETITCCCIKLSYCLGRDQGYSSASCHKFRHILHDKNHLYSIVLVHLTSNVMLKKKTFSDSWILNFNKNVKFKIYTHSLTQSLTHSLTHSFTHSLTHSHSLTHTHTHT